MKDQKTESEIMIKDKDVIVMTTPSESSSTSEHAEIKSYDRNETQEDLEKEWDIEVEGVQCINGVINKIEARVR